MYKKAKVVRIKHRKSKERKKRNAKINTFTVGIPIEEERINMAAKMKKVSVTAFKNTFFSIGLGEYAEILEEDAGKDGRFTLIKVTLLIKKQSRFMIYAALSAGGALERYSKRFTEI